MSKVKYCISRAISKTKSAKVKNKKSKSQSKNRIASCQDVAARLYLGIPDCFIVIWLLR